MFDCIEAWRRRYERRTLAVSRSVAIAALIAGCSYVPDAVNPVEWYKGVTGMFDGDDAPVVAAPRRPDGSFPNVNEAGAKTSSSPGKGLAGDKGNANYAQSVKREPAPTKQLAKKTPQTQTQVAEAPSSAPAPTQDASGRGSYQPSLDRRMQAARDEGPNAPPRTAPGGPPARAEIPDSIPTRRGLLAEHFQKRLAESAVATNKGDPFTGIPAARTQASYNQPVNTYAVPAQPPVGMSRSPAFAADTGERAPQLIPPKGMRGAKGMIAAPKAPAAQFDVASLQFGPSGGLTAADGAQLREVASLQKQTGGVVRIVGYPAPGAVSFAGQDDASVALTRAKAVAKSLTALGVPARKIMVAADAAGPSSFDDSGAKVSIEY
ncbi:hypothetical protein CCC_00185 [Paramagnetospirillum magnetotacticum MS-1]|uniref:OmpA-like domain-containing protein n=1 Tax=Paramagnetospirillum magnetotacticum MS-1 TaxID=272627 RepID=A0A0C2YBN6_PARME|nr:hypothetical protein [Paramagnetospirillum magnetotacticum]KIL97124.1 hypothetical protein CCC_00185 [Paramagnetospirillum magnetotacticum MS-1]